ncbi:uncharacterized protein SRS1_16557 [Sporisorium reilianum f. sp. reilianum]|uniref:DDE Tnp4 domain-containing protein n=1 Tax=Sporisorium reilianum f. sp. reilianum TaxID=72559 RepID=A0A2N8UD39_9BASI|nr:uncharacterized protein SRS1_16557 [Sporisorium reilianum f. sp. reilianum]
MVHRSNKELLLNDIACTLESILTAEAAQQSETARCLLEAEQDAPINTASFDDDSDDDIDIEMECSASYAVMQLYIQLLNSRYTFDRVQGWSRPEKMYTLLQHFAPTNTRSYRGLVRMTPEAFDKLTLKLQQTAAFGQGYMDINRVREIAAVAFYQLGRFGNGASERDVALQCGCSIGSLIGWTDKTVKGLLEMSKEIMAFASKGERAAVSAWVRQRSGVPEWGQGWLVVDGTHIQLAFKLAMMEKEHRNYKSFHSLNVALVIMPHSLRIVESVVGQPGSVQDSKVWTSGSNILKKPRLYLDEGEFIWVDGGYGHSTFTVGPFSHVHADKSKDLKHFNYSLSRVRVRVEHVIAYLKNRFMCLKGYRGNIYRVKDQATAAKVIQACIIAHTFASRYDRDDDLFALLQPTYSEDEIQEIIDSMRECRDSNRETRRTRRAAQRQYEHDLAEATAGMSQTAISRMRIDGAHELCEQMFQVLFRSTAQVEEDTSP